MLLPSQLLLLKLLLLIQTVLAVPRLTSTQSSQNPPPLGIGQYRSQDVPLQFAADQAGISDPGQPNDYRRPELRDTEPWQQQSPEITSSNTLDPRGLPHQPPVLPPPTLPSTPQSGLGQQITGPGQGPTKPSSVPAIPSAAESETRDQSPGDLSNQTPVTANPEVAQGQRNIELISQPHQSSPAPLGEGMEPRQSSLVPPGQSAEPQRSSPLPQEEGTEPQQSSPVPQSQSPEPKQDGQQNPANEEVDEDSDDTSIEIRVKGNDPYLCRCGELYTKHTPVLKDIASYDPTSTTESPTTVSGIPNNTRLVRQMSGGGILPLKQRLDQIEYQETDFEAYEAAKRPWLVVVKILDNNATECTGAIISKRWVMTSKACLCGDIFGCNLKGKIASGELNITVQPAKDYKYPNQTEENLIRPSHISLPVKDPNDLRNDLALIRLDQSLNFSENVMPICLPQGNFSSAQGEVYISGFNFNFLRNSNIANKCRTVGGPSKDKVCKEYVKIGKNISYEKCTMESPPVPKECRELKQFLKWPHLLPAGMQKVTIIRNMSQIDEAERKQRFSRVTSDHVEIECYSETPSEFGWCGTCQDGAAKGESGHCSHDDAGAGEALHAAELSRPSEFGGWGFCEKMCVAPISDDLRYERQTQLLEAMRIVEPEEDCKRYLKSLNTSFYQLCLSTHQNFHKKTVYKWIAPNKFEKVSSALLNKAYVPAPGLTKVGDAGAPIFKIIREKSDSAGVKSGEANAVLVGVLSTNQFNPRVADNSAAKSYTKLRSIEELTTQINYKMMKYIAKRLSEDPPECLEYR